MIQMRIAIYAGRIVLQLIVSFGICYSLFNRCPRFSAPIRFKQSSIIVRSSMRQTGLVVTSLKADLNKIDDGEIDPEDPYSEGFENQPGWLELFPRKRGEPELLRDYPDFASLEPNDPLFLDMPWPTKAGPEASAFGKHMQWRRGLSDGERLRWQKWAVYERLMDKHHFKYSIDDYIIQNMIRDIKKKADVAGSHGFRIEESMWKATARTYSDEQAVEVTAVMKSLYSAFNRKNYDELRALWLPDESVEMTLPGYDKARGPNDVQKMYRQVIKESRPFGAVDARVVSVDCNGYVAVVQSVEVVVPGTELKFAKKKNAPVVKTKTPPVKRVFATTVLRKFNQQWRVTLHHAARFTSSSYTGDQKEVQLLALGSSSTSRIKRAGMAQLSEKSEKDNALSKDSRASPPMTAGELQSLIKDGSLLSVSKMNKEGGWEKVVAVENDLSSRKGGRSGSSGSDDLERLNWAKQQGATLSEEESKSSRRIRLGNDGNLYLGDELVSTTTEKMRSVIQELEDSTPKLNSAISTATSRGTGGPGTGVKSGNSVSGIRVSKEGGVGTAIDENASVSKQTIQALRYLFKAGRISRETKDCLMLDIIDRVVNHETSLVVVAFELLAVKARDSREKLRPWSDALSSGGVGLEEFADQCSVLIGNLDGTSSTFVRGGGFSFSGSNSKQVRSRNSTRRNDNNRKTLVSRSRYDEDENDDDSDDE